MTYDHSRALRSTRRLSCTAAIPLSPTPDFQIPRNNFSKPETQTPSKGKPLSSFKGENNTSRILSEQRQTRETASRNRAVKSAKLTRSSNCDRLQVNFSGNNVKQERSKLNSGEVIRDTIKFDKGGNNNNNTSNRKPNNNITVVYVHEDGESLPVKMATTDEDVLEMASESMSEFGRSRGRRSSEPAVGGIIIRRLQEKVYDEVLKPPSRSGVESKQLRKSIQTKLPSHIVAEEDEEEGCKDHIIEAAACASAPPSASLQKLHLTPTSERDRSVAQRKNTSASSKTNRPAAQRLGRENPQEQGGGISRKSSSIVTRLRRKSEGDLLAFVRACKVHKEGRVQRNKETPENAETTDDVWEALRTCRYLRGNSPPDMKEPEEVAKFVFGREDKSSLPPSSK